MVAIVEPNLLANLVVHSDISKCGSEEALQTYMVDISASCHSSRSLMDSPVCQQTCLIFAIQQLSEVGVFMYLDAGYAGEISHLCDLEGFNAFTLGLL